MNRITVDLAISADEYLKYYRGETRIVSARARDGRRVHFPVKILQPYMTHGGVYGSFEISFDSQGKFAAIQKL